jgi:hypothetical protein
MAYTANNRCYGILCYMDWNTLAAAFVGGISGGGLGSVAALARLRTDRRAALQARQWLDADVVADVRQLLTDISPERRGINLSPDKAAESKKSAALSERSQQVDRNLLRLAAGHSNAVVAEWAHNLSGALVRAVYASEWYVRDLVAGRNNEDRLTAAQTTYTQAVEAAKELEHAVKKAGNR